MAQSIDLGGSTFLDASAVSFDTGGATLDGYVAIRAFTISSALSESSITAALNSNNLNIPSNKMVIVMIVGTSGQRNIILCNKVNDNYGGAVTIGYYAANYHYVLSGGTWTSRSY
jgi:hypothetical protein